jgi:hypothetical protein
MASTTLAEQTDFKMESTQNVEEPNKKQQPLSEDVSYPKSLSQTNYRRLIYPSSCEYDDRLRYGILQQGKVFYLGFLDLVRPTLLAAPIDIIELEEPFK